MTYKEIQNLPKDSKGNFLREFTANGTQYIILNVYDKFNIRRFNELQKLLCYIPYQGYEGLSTKLDELMSILSAPTDGATMRTKALLHLNGIQRALDELNSDDKKLIIYACSLFIVTENEDLETIDKTIADKKLKDWKGINANDFFLLLMDYFPQLKNDLQDLKNQETTNRPKYILAGNG